MLKNLYHFSNAGRRIVNPVFLAGLLSGFFGAAALALDSGTPTPAQIGTEVPLSISGVSSSDPKAKIGDRLTFQADLNPVSGQAGQIINLKPADEKTKLEEEGWYLVQGTLNQNGLLRFIASPLRTGKAILPSLSILDEEGRVIGKTKPFSLTVEGPEVQANEKPDFMDVVDLRLPLRYWIYLSLLLAAFGILVRILYLRYKRRPVRTKPAPVREPTPEPDHILALRKIDELYVRHPFSPANLKFVSFGLSEIIKEFFSKRFKVDALESTTDEMINLLRREALSGEQLRAIQLLFLELDQFKFTKIEDYPSFTEETHSHLKVKATLIIQKWALGATPGEGGSP